MPHRNVSHCGIHSAAGQACTYSLPRCQSFLTSHQHTSTLSLLTSFISLPHTSPLLVPSPTASCFLIMDYYAWLQEAFPQPTLTQEQRLKASRQAKHEQDDMAHMPRIPVMGDDHVPTMTLQELWDWKAKWTAKRRFTTASEDLDLVECNRQIDELDSESETVMDWEEFDRNEQEMDTCPSPTQRNHPAWTEEYQRDRKLRKYEERREQRKRLLSPPRTPPHLKGPGLYRQQYASLAPNSESFRITKGKRGNRKAARRPLTRSSGTPNISLDHRKGYVKFWNTPTMYVVISYEEYLRDYVSLVPIG